MRPLLITPPAIEPISLAEAKAWLREENGDEDQLIQTLLVSARMTLEAWTRRYFITQGWRLVGDQWPTSGRNPQLIEIAFAPFRAVSAIRIYDVNNLVTTLPATRYAASGGDNGGRILFNAAPPAPGRAIDGVEIDIVAGYGPTALQTPEPIRRAILLLVAHWRENRGDETAIAAPPPAALTLCAPYRRERLT